MLAYVFGLLFFGLLLGILSHPAWLWLAAAAAVFIMGAAVVGFFWTLTGRIDPFRFLNGRR